jgi:hypothetical protein
VNYHHQDDPSPIAYSAYDYYSDKTDFENEIAKALTDNGKR